MKVKKLSRKKTFVSLAIVIIMLLIVAVGVFLFIKYQNGSLNSNGSPEAVSAKENEDLIIKVGKLIKLPSETPDIATVTDVNQLQDQTIFRNAQNGDKVLIFANAKRAIVYRPSENIIVEVGNLVVSPQSSSSATLTDEEVKKVSIVVLNATSTAGYASRVGDQLQNKFSNLEIIDTGNAVGDYEKTLIVDVSGENEDSAKAIAGDLDGEVGALPEDENTPDSDILVILAQ